MPIPPFARDLPCGLRAGLRPAASSACMAMALASVAGCNAQPPSVQNPPVQHQAHVHAWRQHVDTLKQAYLDCEHAASHGVLPMPLAMQCSTIYEQLKIAAFGGRYDALHRWWAGERARRQ